MQKNTNKLKVGFVLDDGLDKPDGVQQYILTLGEWFISRGHEVKYLVGETKRKDIQGVISLSKNLKVRFNGNSLSTPLPASSPKIKKLLAKEKFDIIHVQIPYSPFMAAQVVKFAAKNTKIIGTFHVLPVGKIQYFGTKLLGYSLKYNLKKFDKLLSVSGPAQKFAKKTFKIESDVLPNPVNIAKFKNNSKNTGDSINIVFLGRLVPRKGCMQLLKAVNRLQKMDDLPAIELHICGEGNQKAKLNDFIDSTELKNITTMHGFVSEKDKPKYLNQADFAVFPSYSGESFGIVLIEAMAAGSGIVLAGNNPGYASVLHSLTESLFDPTDDVELASKIYDFIKDKSKFNLLNKQQQELVKGFDVNVVGNKLLKIYGSVD